MQEYKSKYINKTWNEITTSFDWVNCQPIDCRILHHKNHYDLQCLEWAKIVETTHILYFCGIYIFTK